MGSDYTIIYGQRQKFGPVEHIFDFLEPGAPSVGLSKDFLFHCPNVDERETAVLMFQSFHVDHNRNILHVNPESVEQPTVFGGLLAAPLAMWNGNIMLIRAGVLQVANNHLYIESREYDDFIIDNIVVMYKTRDRGPSDRAVPIEETKLSK